MDKSCKQLFTSFLIVTLIGSISAAGGGNSNRGKWTVVDPNSNIPCIIFYGQIDLDLSYYQDGTDAETDGHVTVPGSSKVNNVSSSCDTTRFWQGKYVKVQVMQIDFDQMDGWNIQLIFSTDKGFQTNGNEWALVQVVVTANYTSMSSQFPNPSDKTHSYSSLVDLNGGTELADYIYAHLKDSMYCPSKQKYMINNDIKVGPKATMTLTYLQVQAYATIPYYGLVPFGTKETCPTDQHVTDMVPIIVGSVLAGLVVFTMVAYLIYRACLPSEVIQLVNPHSHHENKAMAWDEEEGSSHGHHEDH